MHFTYVLISLKNHDMYIGSAASVEVRLALHNRGGVKSTKAYRPWKLLQSESFSSRREAVQRERFLKNHQQKEILKKRYMAP